MLIEHWHHDTVTYDTDGEDSTWTIKVKHSSTAYQDITTTECHKSDDFGHFMSTISKLTEMIMLMQDVVDNKPISGAHRTEDWPFIVGSQVDAARTLSSRDISEETEQRNDDPLYKVMERRRNETADETDNKREEKHKMAKAGKERKTMDRHPRSRSVLQDIRQHENNLKGYKFSYGVSSTT
jgi:hypothetical protein